LSSLTDFNSLVTELLVTLVDSGYIKGTDYVTEFNAIYRDARVALKKQQARDEKQMKTGRKKTDDDELPAKNFSDDYSSGLDQYAILLMPFYDNPLVSIYFNRMLQSADNDVKLNTTVLMLRNNKKVPDSIVTSLASDDSYRGTFYNKLEEAGKLDKFPTAWKKQVELARSYMVIQNEYEKTDSIVFLTKMQSTLKGKKGYVYFFKYRIRKSDDWKIGLSGLQPLKENEISSEDDFAFMTDKKLKDTEPLDEQLLSQLKKIVYSFHKSAKNFFSGDDNYNNFKYLNDPD
jgi:hypothetical protein